MHYKYTSVYAVLYYAVFEYSTWMGNLLHLLFVAFFSASAASCGSVVACIDWNTVYRLYLGFCSMLDVRVYMYFTFLIR